MTEPKLIPFEVTYAGRYVMQDGKIGYRYHDSRDDAYGIWRKSFVPGGGVIGAVYEVNEVEGTNGSIRIKGEGAPRYVRSLPYDDPRVIEWRAADEVVAVEKARQSALRKAGDPFEEVVQLVAAASMNLTRQQRRALAVRLMEALWLS